MPDDCDIFPCCGDDTLGYEVPSATPNPPATTTFTLTLAVDPALSGTTTGDGEWASDTFVEIEAFPAEGFYFTGWTGYVELSDNPAQVYMDGNKSLTANFAPISIYISLTIDPPGSATATGQGDYDYGDTAILTTTPVGYFQFINYTGDVETTDNPTDVLMNESKSVTANLALAEFTVAVGKTPSVGGTVTGSGTYQAGATATLEAIPATGYEFTEWSDDISSTDNPLDVLIDSNKTITANFTPIYYTLDVVSSDEGQGTVTGSGVYQAGTTAIATALPIAPATFQFWDGDINSNENPLQIVMNSDIHIRAYF